MSAPRLQIESLEARLVPVTWGNPWPAADQLTMSFVPDGTATGGQPTNLFQALNAQQAQGAWQRDILRAFQTWINHANLNLGVVADIGQTLGASGRPQGDPRFGDIRLSAQPFTSEVYALAVPFDPLAGTWSGDIRINSNVAFAGGNAVDLYTALLQEAGHAFGLSNSDDPNSVMFETYDGIRVGLAPVDIARIQALYGARTPDAYEGALGNATFATATTLPAIHHSAGVVGWSAQADLTTQQDADVYRLDTPFQLNGLLLRLERAGRSLVTPRVTVYDQNMHPVATAESTDPLGGDLTLRLNLILPGGTYYVKVEGAGSGFDVGAYRLRAQTLPWFGGIHDFLPEGPVKPLDDNHSDDTFSSAEPLVRNETPGGYEYGLTARIRDGADVDYYRVQAPTQSAGSGALTVTAWGVDASGIQPRVRVFDTNGNLVASRGLVDAGGVFTFQIDVFVPGESYLVEVESTAVGDYFLGLDFNAEPVGVGTLAERSLTESAPEELGRLDVHRTGLFQLQLEGEGASTSEVLLTVYNASGQVVAQLTALGGSATAVTLTLGPGEYRFEVAGQGHNGGLFSPLDYQVRAVRLSDPVGPKPEDPTEDPSTPPPGNPPESWYYDWTMPAP